MSIEAAIRAHLIGDAGLAALVGARVYPTHLPQKPTLPAITYQFISTLPTQDRDDPQASHRRSRCQFDVWAGDYDATLAVRAALETAMGTLAQASGPRIDVALLQNGRNGDFDAAAGRWRASLDYFVWHEV